MLLLIYLIGVFVAAYKLIVYHTPSESTHLEYSLDREPASTILILSLFSWIMVGCLIVSKYVNN